MEYKYKIRPHHGMCIAFFKGKGYSEEFTAHMKDIIKELENNPLVCLKVNTDEFCSKCPYNMQGICESADKVAGYDEEVLKSCGLSDGTVLPYIDVKQALPFFDLLTKQEKELVLKNIQVKEYTAGELIHSADSDCLGLIKVLDGGTFTRMISGEGREITL